MKNHHSASQGDPQSGAKGLIFNIQRYSIQDGPGIRTTVFLKGCPLKCEWCSNPESQNPHPEILHRNQKCLGCGACIEACPQNAIHLENQFSVIDRSLCDLCMDCVSACPNDVLEISGEYQSVSEVVAEAVKDELFYRNSGGGVTLSGGEPLQQPDFAYQILKSCKERSLNTTVDTCGFARWEVMEKFLEVTDLFLFDLKHLDPEQHLRGTAVGNELILSNLEKILDQKRSRVWLRVPVITGYNDSESYARQLAEMMGPLPLEKISLLGYHEWGRPKYGFLGREYPCTGKTGPDENSLDHLKQIMQQSGVEVTIGH